MNEPLDAAHAEAVRLRALTRAQFELARARVAVWEPRAMREPLPPEVWAEVEYRDRVCQASAWQFGSIRPCSGRLRVHHRRLRKQGGTHDLENLVLLCDGHHREVHNYPERAYRAGLLLRTTFNSEGDP